MEYFETINKRCWADVLSSYPDADVYHSYDYIRTCACEDGVTFKLIRIRDGQCEFAMPVLVRKIASSIGTYFDYGSAYGYPGPLFKGDWDVKQFKTCWEEFSEQQKSKNVIALTTRLNPFIDNLALLNEVGEVQFVNKVVVIDLTRPEHEQFGAYRSNHRRDIKKLVRNGVRCTEVLHETRLSEFIGLYNHHMKSLNAASSYFFSSEYYQRLFSSTHFETKLFTCFSNEQAICSGIFFIGKNLVHYHLGATHSDHLRSAPSKLLFDTVRKYGVSRQLKAMHLGGGLGGGNDSLFSFKAGFSNQFLDFRIFNAVFESDTYRQLTEEHMQAAKSQNCLLDHSYRPAYRSPLRNLQRNCLAVNLAQRPGTFD